MNNTEDSIEEMMSIFAKKYPTNKLVEILLSSDHLDNQHLKGQVTKYLQPFQTSKNRVSKNILGVIDNTIFLSKTTLRDGTKLNTIIRLIPNKKKNALVYSCHPIFIIPTSSGRIYATMQNNALNDLTLYAITGHLVHRFGERIEAAHEGLTDRVVSILYSFIQIGYGHHIQFEESLGLSRAYVEEGLLLGEFKQEFVTPQGSNEVNTPSEGCHCPVVHTKYFLFKTIISTDMMKPEQLESRSMFNTKPIPTVVRNTI